VSRELRIAALPALIFLSLSFKLSSLSFPCLDFFFFAVILSFDNKNNKSICAYA
jgi:hypothetical protein